MTSAQQSTDLLANANTAYLQGVTDLVTLSPATMGIAIAAMILFFVVGIVSLGRSRRS